MADEDGCKFKPFFFAWFEWGGSFYLQHMDRHHIDLCGWVDKEYLDKTCHLNIVRTSNSTYTFDHRIGVFHPSSNHESWSISSQLLESELRYKMTRGQSDIFCFVQAITKCPLQCINHWILERCLHCKHVANLVVTHVILVSILDCKPCHLPFKMQYKWSTKTSDNIKST